MKKTQEKVLESSIKATDKPTLHTALYYHFMGSLQDFIGHNEVNFYFINITMSYFLFSSIKYLSFIRKY